MLINEEAISADDNLSDVNTETVELKVADDTKVVEKKDDVFKIDDYLSIDILNVKTYSTDEDNLILNKDNIADTYDKNVYKCTY